MTTCYDILYCGDCKHFKECEKEFCVDEFTTQESVIGCHLGEENVPRVNENGEEELKEWQRGGLAHPHEFLRKKK